MPAVLEIPNLPVVIARIDISKTTMEDMYKTDCNSRKPASG